MNNTTGVNRTSEFLLKKEIIVTERNTQRLEIITILLSRFLCEMTAIKMAINSRCL